MVRRNTSTLLRASLTASSFAGWMIARMSFMVVVATTLGLAEPLPPTPSPARRGGASQAVSLLLPLSVAGRGLGGGVPPIRKRVGDGYAPAPGTATGGTGNAMSHARFGGIRFSVEFRAWSHVTTRPVYAD